MEKLIHNTKNPEAFYKALIENSHEAISLMDIDFKVTYRTPSAETISGWSNGDREKAGGGLEQTHPDDIEKLNLVMKEVIANPDKGVPLAFRTKHKAGHYIWLEGCMTNRLHNENVKAIVTNLRDITERKKFEEKEKLFALIINSSDDAIISVNLDGIITSWSNRAEKDFGYTADEIIGQHVSTIIPPFFRSEAAELAAKIKKGEVIDHYETERSRKDGSIIQVSLVISPVRDLAGTIIGAATISREITERKRRDELQRKISKEIIDYKYTLDVSAIVAITDAKGIITHVNDNFCKISEYSREELEGKDHCIVNSGYHPKEFIKDLWRTIASGNIWKGELKNKAKDGSVYWVDTTIVPFVDDNGKPYQYVAIGADITGRKEGEQELVKVNRLYAFLSAINQNIVHIQDTQELLKKACKVATEIGKFESARIAILDKQDQFVMENAGNDEPIIQKYTGQDFKNLPLSSSPTGIVLNTGHNYVCNESPNELQLGPWKRKKEGNKIGACASFPIRKFGEVVGVFSFLSTEPDFFDQKEITLLEEASGDISFAIEVSETEMDRKIGKEKLQNSQANLYAIIENTDATIYALDKNFRYTAFNHLLKRSLKQTYNLEIKIGDDVFDFLNQLNPEEAKNWEAIYSKAIKGETLKFEKEFNNNGALSFFNFSIHPIWEKGEVIGLSCFAYDITKQKEDENEKARITSDLRQRYADLEQFSFIVSHNLRAPVANILGIANLLKNNYVNKDEAPMIQGYLFDAVSQLDNVITDLNQILQVKRERNEQRDMIVFEELVRDITSSIPDMIEKDNVKIITNFSAADRMRCIKSFLQSIFYNLISNAIKYARLGLSPVINIASEKEAGKLILKFKDNGVGIDLQQHGPNLFKLYRRFHLDVAGKGLGLFMVKTQVEMVGGKITVDSKVNVGTEFRIEFESDE
ncbi:MAG: PAS domain S-box protein [Chryseolinea sp.]